MSGWCTNRKAIHYFPTIRYSKQHPRFEPALQPAVARMKGVFIGERCKKEIYKVVWLVILYWKVI
jgi:hypothetical protein